MPRMQAQMDRKMPQLTADIIIKEAVDRMNILESYVLQDLRKCPYGNPSNFELYRIPRQHSLLMATK